MSDQDSIDLFARVRAGESQAQTELFDRYVPRLLGLVRKRLSPQFARRIDADDVVQSAYRSVFAGASDDRYVLENSGDLWRLLAAITMNKLRRQIERNQAGCRAVGLEQSFNGADDSVAPGVNEGVASEPTPEEELAFEEELNWLTQAFDGKQRQMFELRLAGHTIDEIAEQLECSERTVRRFIDSKLKPMLIDRLGGPPEKSGS